MRTQVSLAIAASLGISAVAIASFAAEPNAAATSFKEGTHYFNKGDFDSAIVAFSKVIRTDPKSADAYCGRGNAYVAKHEAR